VDGPATEQEDGTLLDSTRTKHERNSIGEMHTLPSEPWTMMLLAYCAEKWSNPISGGVTVTSQGPLTKIISLLCNIPGVGKI
jgi:hypothetical protein